MFWKKKKLSLKNQLELLIEQYKKDSSASRATIEKLMQGVPEAVLRGEVDNPMDSLYHLNNCFTQEEGTRRNELAHKVLDCLSGVQIPPEELLALFNMTKVLPYSKQQILGCSKTAKYIMDNEITGAHDNVVFIKQLKDRKI